jgi:hypothetical protein
MKWRKYEQIVDKICAWFLYQQILKAVHELSLEFRPAAVKEVMQYMKKLCTVSTSCNTLNACTSIWKQYPTTRRGSGLYSCLTYLEEVVGRPKIDTLINDISQCTSRQCLLPADKSEITITDNNNIKWRILRKNVHAGNQLMFFQTNQPNNIHVSIPSSWNVQKVHEIHISFDERHRHYRRYKKVMLDEEGGIGYRDGRTVVEHNDLEHATTFTMDQKVECFKIFEAFEAFNNDFHFWCCDEHFTVKSPCRILSTIYFTNCHTIL